MGISNISGGKIDVSRAIGKGHLPTYLPLTPRIWDLTRSNPNAPNTNMEHPISISSVSTIKSKTLFVFVQPIVSLERETQFHYN